MPKTAAEATLEYRQAFDCLKDNNKTQINLMTILAEDYYLFSKEIVDIVVERIYAVPPSLKLPVLYVMDSILKNVKEVGGYRDQIEKVVLKAFVHVFETGDERTRLALHKLRQTWIGYFQRSTLYRIDLAVHEIDPAWPVVTPQASAASQPSARHVPVVMQQPQRSAKVHVNPHFFQKNSVSNVASSQSSSSASARSSVDSKLLADHRRTGETTDDSRDTKRQANVSTVATEQIIVKQEPMDTDVDERISHHSPFTGENGLRYTAGRRTDSESCEGHARADVAKRKSPVYDSTMCEKKPRIRTPPERSENDSPTTSLRPTLDLGSHAFVPCARRTPIPNSTVLQPSQIISSVPGSTPLPAVYPPVGASIPPIMPIAAMPSVFNVSGAPLVSVTTSQPTPGTSHTVPVISSETPKLEGIPANNRIFVDGRAYEVSYVNDVPVIERNGLPHRIYFTGVPRNVIIDGVAYLLGFGENKRVIIDGEEHVLRFGAPSRELYMGSYPFKGAFGGPPIYATINGIRHEIRLSGPPPEVKIEPDPCYELLPHMPRSCAQTATKPTEENGELPSVDVKSLLAKLQKSGILSALASRKGQDEGGDSPNRPSTPPIPSEHRGEVTERLPKPPTDLKEFSMRALRIRYTSVVESLHQEKKICPSCGLRVADVTAEIYQKHLDWHFRENLRSSDASRCREWYLPLEEWLEFSEQDLLTASTSATKTNNRSISDAKSTGGIKSVPCEVVQKKECGVCKEQFEEFWDEDDDVWKLKDCVLGDGDKAYHPGCVLDASVSRLTQSECSSSEEYFDKDSVVDSHVKVKSDFGVDR